MPVTRTPVRTDPAGNAATSAATSSRRPPSGAMNGAGGAPVRSRAAARHPRIRLPWRRSISRNRGNSACIERRSASPPWMPASSGSARYSTASRPKRRPMNDAIDSSPAGGRPGRRYSAAMRSFPRSENARVVANGAQSVGMPNTDASGIAHRAKPGAAHEKGASPRLRTEPVADAELAAQVDGGRLLRKQRVGTGVDDVAVDAFGLDHAAERRRRLEQQERHLARSEEHTSELQSHSDLVCRLLLEKKKKPKNTKDDNKETKQKRKEIKK